MKKRLLRLPLRIVAVERDKAEFAATSRGSE